MRLIRRMYLWAMFRVYRLNLHFDLVLVRRWKWRKYFVRNARVLEIGPGGGPWTLELLQRNNRVTVVDVDWSSLKRLKRKVDAFPLKNKDVRLVNGHAKDIYFQDRYDQIIIFEVLEHIVEDAQTVANLVRHLAPGGELLISTPSLAHIPIAGEGISLQEDGRHVRKGYSFTDLHRLLSIYDMEIVHKDSTAGWFTRKLKALNNAVALLTKSNALLYLCRLFSRPLIYLDFLRPSYPAYSIFIVAVRRRSLAVPTGAGEGGE